jgi:hypothetical protein
MKKKLLTWLTIFLLILAFYDVIFKTRTVTYFGENKSWMVQIKAKLVGLNGSHSIEVRYKGEESIHDVDFHIHPQHYGGVFPTFNKEGVYYYECNDDCGFYDKSTKLLFFISWKENDQPEEKMNFIDLKKIPNTSTGKYRWR